MIVQKLMNDGEMDGKMVHVTELKKKLYKMLVALGWKFVLNTCIKNYLFHNNVIHRININLYNYSFRIM